MPHWYPQIAAEVLRYHKLSVTPVWIEHYPKEATDGHSETFELVVFSSYELKEGAPYLGGDEAYHRRAGMEVARLRGVSAAGGIERALYFLERV